MGLKLQSGIFLVGLLHACIGAKILTILPFPVKSHHNLYEKLVVELAERGHQVTYISSFQPQSLAKYKNVTLPQLDLLPFRKTENSTVAENNVLKDKTMLSPIFILFIPLAGLNMADQVMETDVIQKLIKSDEEFDLIIGPAYMMDSLLGGLSQKFNAPIVGVNTFMANMWSSNLLGNPFPTAYLPETFSGFSNKMSFNQRLVNFVIVSIVNLQHALYVIPAQEALMRKHFGAQLPPLDEILKNISLVLVNHHHGLASPRPNLPNMVEVGGFHVNPAKPLPTHIQKFMDESTNGVVLFSMGSIIQSSQMPLEIRQSILKVFSRLKHNVLWKYEDDTISNLPANVKVVKWLPQSDILAHPNLKLLVTHGGLLSVTEAVFHGVPIVGLPAVSDGPTNVKLMVELGLGVSLDLKSLTEDLLLEAINEVLKNPNYAENAKIRSQILRDTPLPAIDTAIYWIEYVIRYKGASHLRCRAQDLAWYQLNQLDVISVLVLATLVVVALNVCIAKFVCKRLYYLIKKIHWTTSAEKKTK